DDSCRPPRLVRRDAVHTAGGREHVRERELVAGRAELVAEARLLVLGDEALAVLEQRQPERARVDLQRETVLRVARAARAQQTGEGGGGGQPPHRSDQATSRSAPRSSRDTGCRRSASTPSVSVIAARRL